MRPISNAQNNSHRIELASQHTIQSDDLMQICHLANVEGLQASLEDWSFEQFFGFTLHLFITTESADIRVQVAQILPKFGSKVVLPLVKIAHHFRDHDLQDTQAQGHNEVSWLAQQSVSSLTPEALCFGLQAVFTHKDAAMLLPVVGEILAKLPEQRNRAILAILSQLLPEQDYENLENQLATECSRSQLQTSFDMSRVAEQMATPASTEKIPQKEAHLVA